MQSSDLHASHLYSPIPATLKGEILDISVSNGVITLTKTFRHKTLEERATEFNGKLMLDGEYAWNEPVGR